MPNHRNVYISLATSMSKTGKFQLTPLVTIKGLRQIIQKRTSKVSQNIKDLKFYINLPIQHRISQEYKNIP